MTTAADKIVSDFIKEEAASDKYSDTVIRASVGIIYGRVEELKSRLDALAKTCAPDGNPVTSDEWKAIEAVCTMFVGSLDRAGGTDKGSNPDLLEMERVARRFSKAVPKT